MVFFLRAYRKRPFVFNNYCLFKNGNELASNDRIEIAQNGKEHTLVLKTTLKSDEGVIKFKSDKGDFELDFTLTVTGNIFEIFRISIL